MSDNNDNKIPPDTLVLRLTRTPWRVDIGGSITDVDLAVAVLNQALDFFETQRFFASVDKQERMRAAMAMAQKGSRM